MITSGRIMPTLLRDLFNTLPACTRTCHFSPVALARVERRTLTFDEQSLSHVVVNRFDAGEHAREPL